MPISIRFILIFSLISSILQGDERESFMSEYEYGEMLYKNPRGISCVACHGDAGEGKTIVEYHDRDGKHTLHGSDIRKSNLATMIKALNGYHDVMPRYYLTNDEIEAIYKYLRQKLY